MPFADDRGGLHLGPDRLVGASDGGDEGVRQAFLVVSVCVDHEDDVVTGLGGAAQEDGVLGHLPDYGYVDGVIVAVRMRMTSHYGDPELPDALLHPADDLSWTAPAAHGHDVHHAEGTPAHRRDVVDVHQHREIAGHVGVRPHEGLHYAVRREQDELVPHVQDCGVLALGRMHLREPRGREEVHDLVDPVLPGHARERPDCLRHLVDRHMDHH